MPHNVNEPPDPNLAETEGGRDVVARARQAQEEALLRRRQAEALHERAAALHEQAAEFQELHAEAERRLGHEDKAERMEQLAGLERERARAERRRAEQRRAPEA